ncbi:MAG TPA: ribonuclease III [Bacteroidales bacterium]|nr:ribonuclease III [Bacteroidales bacterium]
MFFKRANTAEQELAKAIRNIFGYSIGNRALYKLAFRHRSAASVIGNGVKNSNERLEYLGDAVLGSIVAEYLFKKYPYKDEGHLTEMRSRIVSRSNLNALSRKLGIDKLIQTGRETNFPTTSILGDAFEALIGAIYLDKGYDFTKKILLNKVISIHLDIDHLVQTEINFKSKVIEYCQREKKSAEFIIADELENGKQNRKLYVVHLLIQGELVGKGHDYSIKKAEQKAAEQAWIIFAEKNTFE